MPQLLAPPAGLDALRPQMGTGRLALRSGRIVLACAVGLTLLGFVMLYSWSSARGLAVDPHGDANRYLGHQVQWICLAALAGLAAYAVPLAWMRRGAVPFLATMLVLVGLVLLFGHTVKGATRWFRFGGFSFQPSELLKLAVVLYLADRLARREEDATFGLKLPLYSILAPTGLGAVLVLLEPDLGTALFLIAETVVLLALAGVRPTRFMPFVVTVGPLLLFYAYTRFGHVRKRLMGTGDQVKEALVAIGSGGLTGLGLGEGAHKYGFVPEIETDFIFALVGEELGFLGTVGVVITFMLFTWFGSRVAWHARAVGPYACYVAAGAVFIVAFQAVINLAVVTGLAPTKGIALPFLSKGGSNLLMVSVCVGLLLNIARRTADAVGEDPWAVR